MTSESASEDSWLEKPGLGKALTRGGIVGLLLAGIVVFVGMLALDIEWQSAVALGLFVGFWGGLGFGVMLAGVTWVSQNEDGQKQH